MHQLAKNGDRRAAIVNTLIGRRDRLIGALLIGNNLVNILASALATSIFLKLFGESGIALATVAMTVVIVIFAEITPKSWAISSADRFALAVAPVVRFAVAILGPFAYLTSFIVRSLLRLIGIRLGARQSLLSAHEELRGAVEVLHREGSVVRDDRYRLGGILDLHELEVSDVMIHRTKMQSINCDEPAPEIVRQILDSPLYPLAGVEERSREHRRHRARQGRAALHGIQRGFVEIRHHEDRRQALVRAGDDDPAGPAQRVSADARRISRWSSTSMARSGAW